MRKTFSFVNHLKGEPIIDIVVKPTILSSRSDSFHLGHDSNDDVLKLSFRNHCNLRVKF